MSWSAGDNYQHIEFGVDEVMSAEPVAFKDPPYKVSSTLNPQAPEFILGCQASQKALPTATPDTDIPDGADLDSDSLCCTNSEISVLGGHQACSDMDGVSGGLGQRKKKKKRPPGYYNYLEGSDSNSTGLDADEVGGSGLVNGHTSNAPEDMVGEELLHSASVTPTTSTPQTAAPISHQRTCDSPENSTLDLTNRAAALLDRNGAGSLSTSSSSSQSSGVAHFARTAEQHADPLALESPELLGNGGHSPSPPSPIPPSAAVATPTVNTISATTDDREAEGSGEANGLPETTPPAETADRLQDSSETGDAQSASSVTPLPVDSEVQPVVLPAPPAAPVANAPKSWASLFHNAKPLPGGPQAYVEVKSVPAVVTLTPVVLELPEKSTEVHEDPVPVSEDPMALKLGGRVLISMHCT